MKLEARLWAVILALCTQLICQASAEANPLKKIFNVVTAPARVMIVTADVAWYQTELNNARSYCDLKPVYPDSLEAIQIHSLTGKYPEQKRKWVRGGRLRYALICAAYPLIFTEFYIRDTVSFLTDKN